MAGLGEVIQQTRDEFRSAYKAAEGNKEEQDRIQAELEDLANLQERLSLDELLHHAEVLNGLSDLLDRAIADIRENIANYTLSGLEKLKARVDTANGQPASPVSADSAAGGGSPGGGNNAGDPVTDDAAGHPVPSPPAGSPIDLAALMKAHRRFADSVSWQLAKDGLRIDGQAPEVTAGQPSTVKKIWKQFGEAIEKSATDYGVPTELIVATICTESSGKEKAIRLEPGYVSDTATPGKVSPGLMQTLINTARSAMNDPSIDRAWLMVGANSIAAGTAYMRSQFDKTGFDPPVVACAYNAGSVLENTSADNRWRMRQFPIGTSAHADRFVQWFNDCFRFYATLTAPPDGSFYKMLNS